MAFVTQDVENVGDILIGDDEASSSLYKQKISQLAEELGVFVL